MKTVLIVDDDRVMTTVIGVWLKNMGHAVMVEHDVPEALGILKKRLVDAIILDLGMPGGNGTEVIERLKMFNRTGNIPIVVLSANDDPQVAARVLAFGADKYLVKPASSQDIANHLAELFERQDAQRAAEEKDRRMAADRPVQPVTKNQGTLRGLESLARMDLFPRFLRKAAH